MLSWTRWMAQLFFWHQFLAAAQGWEKMNPVFDFLKSGTETVCK